MGTGMVVIGTSLGGISALKVLLGGLTATFPAVVAVVQHRHKDSHTRLDEYLQPYSPMPIHEVIDKDEFRPGHVYLAPPDYHLLINAGYFSLSTDEPVCFARPSIDVLFESAADTYAALTTGVILTGANHDGAYGLAKIKACGGTSVVQDPATAESCVMPKAAIAATSQVDAILPLSHIASYLVACCSSAGDG